MGLIITNREDCGEWVLAELKYGERALLTMKKYANVN